ncbi:hypothetical protein BDR03DRAFT_955924 [Suillus americanus]|nr:hypothetical protein BDR03DRAFT_955924 [Suillus americanus]
MWSMLHRLPSESSTLEKTMQLGSAAIIIFEHVYHLLEQQRSLEQQSVRPLRVALHQYMVSPNAVAVREAVSSAAHAYEAGFSRWIPGSTKRSQKKAELIDAITDVVLQHRLSIPEV